MRAVRKCARPDSMAVIRRFFFFRLFCFVLFSLPLSTSTITRRLNLLTTSKKKTNKLESGAAYFFSRLPLLRWRWRSIGVRGRGGGGGCATAELWLSTSIVVFFSCVFGVRLVSPWRFSSFFFFILSFFLSWCALVPLLCIVYPVVESRELEPP